MNKFERFELRRKSDQLVYSFKREERTDGLAGYKRSDGDYWIVKRPDLGWVAWDFENNCMSGRPWFVEPSKQGDQPPEGEWVSKKGVKSYVYDLVYV